MPQVASDPKIHSHGHTTPASGAVPAQQTDRAAFAIREPARRRRIAPAGPTIGTPAQNKTAPVEESRSPSKTDECKSPSANDRTTTKKADETDCVGADAEDRRALRWNQGDPRARFAEDASGTENSKPRAKRSRRPPQIPVIRRLCRPQ